ncbi:VOC family protein [Sandaracinus amylolyticus]|uniref:VOC family protein n=1 Tax=Sandaracinus amylolyticus TaxID=927083 RepID=UPI001F2C30A3|nr:VOC family protein [Sandaracinus amylolyticus]UJR84750.1 Hypothetical protein I5071_68290 [Sandaracinus amylolyticus]
MGQPVMHFELIASAPERLKRFYTTLFGWRAEDQEGMDYAMLRAGEGRGIEGGLGGTSTGLTPGLAIYVQVEDVDAHLARARELGASEVLQEAYDVPGVGRFAVLRDPEGNRVGLWAQPRA